jgi:GNAT superfamily N-acetyltransferase
LPSSTDAITVRPARRDDVGAMSAVLTASIVELCHADHAGDPVAMAAWTANKTPEGVTAMMDGGMAELFVAERGRVILAVGAVSGDRISLNYVEPAARFTGVSKALLVALEAELLARGIERARLDSTATAFRFYLGAGWQADGDPPPRQKGPLRGYPMSKRLGPSRAGSGAA